MSCGNTSIVIELVDCLLRTPNALVPGFLKSITVHYRTLISCKECCEEKISDIAHCPRQLCFSLFFFLFRIFSFAYKEFRFGEALIMCPPSCFLVVYLDDCTISFI